MKILEQKGDKDHENKEGMNSSVAGDHKKSITKHSQPLYGPEHKYNLLSPTNKQKLGFSNRKHKRDLSRNQVSIFNTSGIFTNSY